MGLQLGIGKAVTGKGVQSDVGVAEFVIEERTCHACRKGVPDVADLLAHLVEGVGDLPAARRALDVDENHRISGPRIGAHIVEMRRLLHLALDLVDHLALHVLGGRAGPGDLHHHQPEGEVRVFLLAHIHQRERPSRENQHDEKARQAGMLDGPARHIEPARRLLRQFHPFGHGFTLDVRAGDQRLVSLSVCGGGLHDLLGQAHLHPVAEELDAAGHDHFAGLQARDDLYAIGIDAARFRPAAT